MRVVLAVLSLVVFVSLSGCDTLVPAQEPPLADPEERADVIARGIEAFRTPGIIDEGASCANCHAPDGLDLAYFDFSDEDLLRRGSAHASDKPGRLSHAQLEDIVALVHALRAEHQIIPKDPKTHRPLQPGGEVLPGDTPQERDLAFGQQLEQTFRFASVPVLDRKEAMRQRDEWLAVNPRTLPIGIPLNRWSEDPHHGPAHASLADWLPLLPRIAREEYTDDWWALHDAYLANPTDERLFALLNSIQEYTGTSYDGNGAGLMRHKYGSVLLAQHFFRREVTGGEQFEDYPAVAFPVGTGGHRSRIPSHVWQVGDWARVNDHLPKAEIPEHILDHVAEGRDFREDMKDVKLSWFWSGWLFDQSLQFTCCGNSTRNGEYLTHFINRDWKPDDSGVNGSGYGIHNVFFATKRQITENFDPVHGRDDYLRINYANFHGYGWDISREPRDHEPERQRLYREITLNSYRMMLYLLLDAFETNGVLEERRDRWQERVILMANFIEHASKDAPLEHDRELVAKLEAWLW